jgi:hypothetical protein
MRNIGVKADDAGDTLSASAFNANFGSELENFCTSADFSLDPEAGPDTNLNMMGQSAAAYANAGQQYQDSGAANAYVLSIATNLKSVSKYYDGLKATFKPGNTNTGASTVNIASLGVKSITREDGTTLLPGDITADKYVTIIYNLTNDRFELVIVELSRIGKNSLINGDFSISQRGTSFDSTTNPLNDDDEYLIDRWVLLSDGNNVVDVSQQQDGGVTGNSSYIRLDVETVSKKFGILQIIENQNCKNLIGSKSSLSFEARVSDITKLSDIRAVVVAWDSTKDVVVSDIISSWNAEGVRPTLVANWTEENIDADLGVTTSWARFEIGNISIDTANAVNIGIFIYQNNVGTNDTLGTLLEITNVQLESGIESTDFEQRQIGHESLLCKRYYERITSTAAGEFFIAGVGTNVAAEARGFYAYEVEKRIDSVSFDDPGGGALQSYDGTTIDAAISRSVHSVNKRTMTFTFGSISGVTAGKAHLIGFNALGDFVGFDAEL